MGIGKFKSNSLFIHGTNENSTPVIPAGSLQFENTSEYIFFEAETEYITFEN